VAPPRRSILRRASAIPGAIALAIWLAPSVLGHGGAPRVVVTPEPIQPGGVIEVSGEDLGADLDIRVVLQGSDANVEIAAGVSDGEGHLTAFLQVPADMAVGMYALNLVTPTGDIVARTPIQLAGTPIVDGGAPNQLEREAVPLASAARDPAGVAGPAKSGASVPVTRPTEIGDVLVLLAAIALPVAAGLALVSRRRRAAAVGGR
jgi:hypothetical protein